MRDVFPQRPVPDGWYAGKRIAIDGHNVAFRYLTSIRGKDGAALQNSEGRTIAHLLGFTGLVRQMRMQGAEPIVIWDGPVHPRKQATVNERIRKRQETLAKVEEARAAGDHQLVHRLMRGTVYLAENMINDASRLLEAVGVAVVTADHDGERYGAALCHAGYADAVATEDFDALVAGAPWVLRKAGGGEPFMHHLHDIGEHGLDQRQLRQLAIVCGTDWHPGVKGFGAKTAIKAMQDYPDLEVLFEETEAGKATTRYHKLVAASDMSHADFVDLDGFIANLPEPAEPRATTPSVEIAAAVADEMGIQRERATGCFC